MSVRDLIPWNRNESNLAAALVLFGDHLEPCSFGNAAAPPGLGARMCRWASAPPCKPT
jgi:hypothetical protein